MSRLIGVNLDWREAREATKYTQKFFFLGDFLLTLGVLLLAYETSTDT
jgi:NAD(P)H-quinone oxidoreductase subunit 5